MEMAFVASSRLQTELDATTAAVRITGAFLNARPQLFIASMLVGNNSGPVLCGVESGSLVGEWVFGVSDWQRPPTVACLGHPNPCDHL